LLLVLCHCLSGPVFHVVLFFMSFGYSRDTLVPCERIFLCFDLLYCLVVYLAMVFLSGPVSPFFTHSVAVQDRFAGLRRRDVGYWSPSSGFLLSLFLVQFSLVVASVPRLHQRK